MVCYGLVGMAVEEIGSYLAAHGKVISSPVAPTGVPRNWVDHGCPKFPLVGWWKKRGLLTPLRQVNDDRWYTKPAPLFLPERHYWTWCCCIYGIFQSFSSYFIIYMPIFLVSPFVQTYPVWDKKSSRKWTRAQAALGTLILGLGEFHMLDTQTSEF